MTLLLIKKNTNAYSCIQPISFKFQLWINPAL